MDRESLFNRRKSIPVRNYISVIILFFTGTIISFFLFWLVHNWERTSTQLEFESWAKVYTNAVESTLQEYIGALWFLEDFFDNSYVPVSRLQFDNLSKSLISRYHGIQAFGWDLLVKDKDRADKESAARKEGFDNFEFTEKSETNEMIRAARREEYIVVYYLSPLEGNLAALGFDLASDETRLKAITHAFNTGELSATGRITLVQETGSQDGVLLLQPIYFPGVSLNSEEDRWVNRKGFIVEVLRIREVVEAALEGFVESGVSMTLYDMSAEKEKHFLYTWSSQGVIAVDQPKITEETEKYLSWSKTFNIADRQWKIVITPTEYYQHSHRVWQAWMILLGLLLLTTSFSFYMLRKLKYTAEVEEKEKIQSQTNILLENEISDRLIAERNLHNTLLFKDTILTESPVGLAIYEAISGQCIATNESMAKLIGATLEQVLSQNYTEIVSWEKSGLLATAKAALKENVRKHHVAEARTTYGKNIITDCHIAPFIFDEKQHILLTASDITRRVQAEKNIETQKEKVERYLNLAGVMFIGLDKQGDVNLANNKALKVLECSEKDIVGLNWFDNFIPESIRTEMRTVFDQLIAGTVEPVEYYENNVLTKSGKTKNIAWHNTNIPDETGQIMGILGSGEDVTEKKELEKRLQRAQKMESVGTLAGGIAHEFNNMLTVIIGNNELIMNELPQSSLARESAEEIRIAGLRARDVVKQLLTFSRQDDAVKKIMDLKIVVQESMKLIRSSTPANIKIEQNLSADTYPIMGNNTQINQLLINICNNAADALPEKGGIITIELLNETIDMQQIKHLTKLNPGQYAKLVVSDNGIGMDKEILDRVFEPYFTTKDIGKGTGIGMAVVHGIVERHGGEIAVESRPGRGTTFTIFLPAHEGLFEQETDEQDILPVGDEDILYVDDEPSISILGKRLLDGLGYTTESTTDPEKALDMVRSDPNKFDLLITDMAMPNMTGVQLIIETLKIRQNMPTIICTGYSAKISEKEAADIGVSSFIMKPINISELAKMVRKILDEAKGADLIKP